MGRALGVSAVDAANPDCVIEALQGLMRELGVPDRLEGVSGASREQALASSLFNFNADRSRQLSQHQERLSAILREAT